MFEGQILFKGNTVFGPWMQRRGDNIQFTLDLIARSGTTMAVTLFTKNTEDPGDGTVVDVTAISTSTVGQVSFNQVGGLLELVRYQYVVTGTNNYDWCLFRMLAPVWYDTVAG